ncbi:hypothetical protein SDC9_107713 [bioreactor metagenome]|uniref:Uncharacterized protein n=1 Tax=bioreactor metagenome TaxID=1076179 RepID=A0A645B5Z1_9ZZZZ
MPPSGQGAQHGKGILPGLGLAQNPPVQIHHRVRGDHQAVRLRRGHGTGLALRQHRDQPSGGGSSGQPFVGLRGDSLKGKAHIGQQLPPPGGIGRQNDLHGRPPFLSSMPEGRKILPSLYTVKGRPKPEAAAQTVPVLPKPPLSGPSSSAQRINSIRG